nr:hypothetical protein [Legionella jordanis]
MFERYLQILDEFKERNIAQFLKDLRDKFISSLSHPYFSPKAKIFFNRVNKEGEPFTDFAEEPKQIVQIKQVINALYHAQLAFEDLQSVDLRSLKNAPKDLIKLYSKTIEHGYKASSLLTNLDIDFTEILGSNIQQRALEVLSIIEAYTDEQKNSALEWSTKLKDYQIPYNTGWASGVAIDQMTPNGGNFDYDFLAQFGAVLPGYIQQLTLSLQKLAPQISTFQPTMDKAKLEELQEAAFKLLKSIENLQSGDIIVSFKALNYIKIVRQIITLSMSTLEQIGYMNESSQIVVRHNLRQLKYEYLPILFQLIDRLEDQALLNPGTLSRPLMEKIKPWYELLGMYASKIVDFSMGDEELLSLENPGFIECRLAQTRQRIASAKWNLHKNAIDQKAFSDFFSIVENRNFIGYSVFNLPAEVKTSLAREYLFLHPYIKAIDPELATAILQELASENTWGRQISRAYNWVTRKPGALALTTLLGLKEELQNKLAREKATHLSHVELNENIITAAVQDNTLVFPHTPSQIPCINEAIILGLDPQAKPPNLIQFNSTADSIRVANPEQLSAEQSRKLYEYYSTERCKFKEVQAAWTEFSAYVKNDPNLSAIPDAETKAKLRRAYALIQPYFLSTFLGNPRTAAHQDAAIITKLSETPLLSIKTRRLPLSILCFSNERIRRLNSKLVFLASNLKSNSQVFKNLAKRKYSLAVESSQPKVEEHENKRAHFVLKHTEYSKAIADYRSSLQKLTDIFSNTFKQQFQPQSKGIPFPELEDRKLILAERSQVIALKRLFNSLYHLEEICLELESLDNTSAQWRYVSHLIQAKNHADELFNLAKGLATDQHFAILAGELKEKALAIYAAFKKQQETYVVASEEVHLQAVPEQEKAVRYNGLWYSLHTFMIIPEHIKAALNNKHLLEETKQHIDKRAKQASINIERIIEESNSYFKLFLEAPTMYSLYKELKQKLKDFTTISHSAALSHLEELNEDLFVRILLEADAWEEKLGLKPGLLADPMKAMLDEFYRGLLEPLQLSSQEEIGLISTLAPISHRMVAAQKRQQAAQGKMFIVESVNIKLQELNNPRFKYPDISTQDSYLLLSNLLEEINHFRDLNAKHWVASNPLIKELAQERLTKLFETALPLLMHMRKTLHFLPEAVAKKDESVETFFQTLLKRYQLSDSVEETGSALGSQSNPPLSTDNDNHELPSHEEQPPTEGSVLSMPEAIPEIIEASNSNGQNNLDARTQPQSRPGLTNVTELVSLVLSYYRGQHNSAVYEFDSAKERLDYLEELKLKQEEANAQFIKTYTKKAYEKQFQIITSKYIGLLHTRDEYKKLLQEYILLTKEDDLLLLESSQDINAEIEKLLKAKTREFARAQYKKYFQLEAIRASLAEFEVYISKKDNIIASGSDFFEDEHTLSSKRLLIDELKELASSPKTVEQRLSAIRERVEKSDFKPKMLAHRHYNTLSFSWIAQWLLSLINTLGFYTAKNQIITERLTEAAKNPPNPNRTLRHFGFFSGNNNERSYDLPRAVASEPTLNNNPAIPVL